VSSLDVRSIDDKDLRREPCPATRQEFRVFLSEAAFDRAVARGDSDTTREIGGVLVGEVLRDEAGPYLRIEAAIDALHAEEKGAELTFTHATWEHIHKEMDGKHQDKRVVGWYHTHPGFGVFLSDRDQFIQKSFFNLPFQVAFVYDPKSREHGMFTWHDNEVWRARRYWIGPREQAWDGPRTAPHSDKLDKPARKPQKLEGPGPSERSSRSADVDNVREMRDDAGLSGSLGSLIVVGVLLLLIGGFVGRWLGMGTANELRSQVPSAPATTNSDRLQLEVTMLQSDLVGVLRNTLGDEAVHAPIMQAVGDLDRAIVTLVMGGAAVPGTAAPGGGSAATPGAGSAVVNVPPASAGSAAISAVGDPRLQQLAIQLKATRDQLSQLLAGRASAQGVLAQLERLARHSSELRADLGHDVAEQRSGLGALYADLAADAVKAKDLQRARRLLATAAHLDPGNRARYEEQLWSFDQTSSLPRDRIDNTGTTGSAGQGSMR
jgi:proteasome lid subunit RPN8/RPN11